ncbi:MAG TPA: carboxypeptidase-like regulatory domain-containing protein [Edaphocola sp.]|nr:carboxypeptidase-like regulatory domain-containing protein [Edaphocola sp.]
MAQTMKGKVYNRETNEPLTGVNIINLNTQMVFRTDSTGLFSIKVRKGQMIEFQKHNFQTAQVEINSNTSLPYYSIGLHKGAYELPEVTIKGTNFKSDSIENQEVYKWALDHYTLEGIDIIQHPFDALSKRNRQIWAFQKRFHYFEQQKFIDYVFNEELIKKITGLSGDMLSTYRRQYRPEYEQIQAWTTYQFYEYIQQTGKAFKQHHQLN